MDNIRTGLVTVHEAAQIEHHGMILRTCHRCGGLGDVLKFPGQLDTCPQCEGLGKMAEVIRFDGPRGVA